ncbi:MAG: hypothetical protein EVB00_02140 [SAR86 cluster bacterium]|uniref:Uncharacterized protein n=1 Tax=SAR86 cluster bacterium TaxID=2030880 RepID=A0A520M8P9_9GAMM|nr:MAG: hypothetical protein EVB00_02140 [SAR86 cluster bacterium]
MIRMRRINLIRISSALMVAFIFMPIDAYAQSNESSKSKKQTTYKKARVLQSSTAKKIAKVTEALERVKIVEIKDTKKDSETFGQMIPTEEPDPDWNTVYKILREMISKSQDMKSYDRSIMWNYWGYTKYSEEDYQGAIEAYTKVINEEEVTLPLRTGTLLTLATLHMVEEDYAKGIELILVWMDEVETVTAQSWSLLMTAYFAEENYRKSLDAGLQAVSLAEIEGYTPKENWYATMAACYDELKAEFGEKVTLLKQLEIFEILVNLYPKKRYFLNLAQTYGSLEREQDYMVALNAAYMKDYLDKEGEYLTLAQLLLMNNNPYQAAKVIVYGQNKKVLVTDEKTKKEELKPVVKDSEKVLKLLADSWRMAQEINKAIPVLEEAAKLSKDGETFVLLGNLYLAEDKLEQAISSIEKGIKKGKLKKKSQAHLTLGQAQFELQNFEEAKKQFRMAARDKDKKIKKTANSWIKYTENEEIRVKNIKLRRDYIQQS